MESNWAANQLQVIRTLMERSAIYRRALAPIMIYNGVLGSAAGLAGWKMQLGTVRAFVLYWAAVALVGLAGSFLLVRKQAIKDSEPFWSPPTRRIAQAMFPGLMVGSALGFLGALFPDRSLPELLLVGLWSCLYGCALTAAGFFMARGIRWLGWIFVGAGSAMIAVHFSCANPTMAGAAHLVMGAAFGGLHLAYGIYLYFTEARGNEA
jgi:hypothetical protein